MTVEDEATKVKIRRSIVKAKQRGKISFHGKAR